ncbi:MAG: N-acyl-D-amino-acid deacylase family protein [Woeseiaceae bacterium]
MRIGHRVRVRALHRCAGTALLAGLFGACGGPQQPFLPELSQIDLLISDGRVLDGTGAPAFAADIVVADGVIAYVGQTAFTSRDLSARVARHIDARGRYVTPGFIDLHAHGDPLEHAGFENFLAMGATTVTLGQDGVSPDVGDLGGWLDRVAEAGTGPNIAVLVGHGSLRERAGIGMTTVPADEDLARMLAMLDESLDVAFGMSTGLEYNPGLHAQGAELRALAKVVGRRDRVVMSHLRNEDDDRLEASIAELLEQGEHARVHISHLKSVYGKGAERAEEILGLIDAARAAGIDVTADLYPYSASYTGIEIVFPVWAKTEEQFRIARAERRDELADYLRERIMQRNGPEATLLGTEPWRGMRLSELADLRELPFEDVLIDVIGPQGASGAYFVMNDELQERLFRHPFVGVCSDGSPTGFHPRGHGTFARIIESYVLDKELVPLGEAIRRMSSFPASILKIPDRGLVAAGYKADLLIFEPQEVRETASYLAPISRARGFDFVIVNGELAWRDGRPGAARSGQVLRPLP